MGGQESIVYAVDLPGQEQPADSTKIRRNPKCVNGLFEGPSPKLKTMKDILMNTFKLHPNNNVFGKVLLLFRNHPSYYQEGGGERRDGEDG